MCNRYRRRSSEGLDRVQEALDLGCIIDGQPMNRCGLDPMSLAGKQYPEALDSGPIDRGPRRQEVVDLVVFEDVGVRWACISET